MASAVNVLGDVHGGAEEQAVELYHDIARRYDDGMPFDDAVAAGLAHPRPARQIRIGVRPSLPSARSARRACWNWSTALPTKAWCRGATPRLRAPSRKSWAKAAPDRFR
jgi:hypothetical protein